MYCSNCGNSMDDTCKFCPVCGAKIQKEAQPPAQEAKIPPENLPVTERMQLFPDGKYRWMRRADLMGNASQLKFVLLCAGCTCFGFSLILCFGAGLISLGLWACIQTIVLFTGIALLVTLLVYWLAVHAIGKTFYIVYEMDPHELLASRRLTNLQDLRWSAAGYIMGLVSNPVFAMDYFHLMSSHHTVIHLENVRSVRWEPKRQAEKLSGSFGSHRIYVDAQDAALFAAYLRSSCPGLKKIL